ncbi:hypothetical protein C8R46DRAFT_1091250, partial [Mycena filopes]
MQHYSKTFPSYLCTMNNHTERSLFVTLAAQAISGVGFSVSILAWIWLTLVPPRPELTEPILIDKKARRRSAPATLPSRKRNSLSPSIAESTATRSPTSEVLPSPISPPRTRRVYFIDSPSESRPSISNDRNDSSESGKPFYTQPPPTSEISPSSSSSTLVHTYTAIPAPTLETWRESAVESDSSNSSPRPSLSSLSRGPFRTRRSSDVTPIITAPAPDGKQARKGSGSGFTPPWGFRRASGSKNSASAGPSTSADASLPVAAPSLFKTRKASRRVSTPVPRTQPYAHPYYAQPPIEDDVASASPSVAQRALPQFGSGAETATSPNGNGSDSDKDKGQGQGRREPRPAGAEPQSAGGAGRGPAAASPAAVCERELGCWEGAASV